MTATELQAKVNKRKEWMGDDETQVARSKLFSGQILTIAESEKLANYIRKLELSLDKVLDM